MMFENLKTKEPFPWFAELRVGIDYVCKFIQYIWTWWMLDKNKYLKKSKFEKKKWIINILMYVNFFVRPIFTEGCWFNYQKNVSSLNKYKWKSTLLKKAIKPIAKKL